jgi:hypothetical protein
MMAQIAAKLTTHSKFVLGSLELKVRVVVAENGELVLARQSHIGRIDSRCHLEVSL